MTRRKVIVARHGEKDKDNNLTPKGATQIYELTLYLVNWFTIKELRHTLELRTLECAKNCLTAIGKTGFPVIEDNNFHPGEIFRRLYGDNKAFAKDFLAITNKCNTVAYAKKVNESARASAEQITKAIIKIADVNPPLVISHSPFASLGAPDHKANEIFYHIPEGSAIVYEVDENDTIVGAEYVPPLSID